MKILAIDPSSTCIGYAYFENEILIESGYIYVKGNSISEKLKYIKNAVSELLMKYDCDNVILETNISCYSRNTKRINLYQFTTGFIAGIIDIDKLILVPVSEWKKQKSEELVSNYAKIYYSLDTDNKDELTAVWLGHWYINQLKLLKQIL